MVGHGMDVWLIQSSTLWEFALFVYQYDQIAFALDGASVVV